MAHRGLQRCAERPLPFAPFEEFVNNSFSIPTLVYYLTVTVLFLFLRRRASRSAAGTERGTDHEEIREKKRRTLERLRLHSGIYAAAWSPCWCIVLAVLLNLIVRAIPTRYTEFDLSEAGLFTLSDSSKEIVRRPDTGCDHLLSGRDGQTRTPSSPSC